MELPEWLQPTDKTEKIILGLFVLVLVISLFSFPLGRVMNGQTDIQYRVGWPVPFLILDMENSSRNPFLMAGLFADLFFYIVVAYWLDIFLTVSWKQSKKQFKRLLAEMEEKYRKRKQTL